MVLFQVVLINKIVFCKSVQLLDHGKDSWCYGRVDLEVFRHEFFRSTSTTNDRSVKIPDKTFPVRDLYLCHGISGGLYQKVVFNTEQSFCASATINTLRILIDY